MKTKIGILILMAIVILNHCKKDAEISQRIIIPDENKKANVSFSLDKRTELPEIDNPGIAVAKEKDRVYLYGKYTIKNKKGFIVKIYNKELEFISQKLFYYGQGPGDVGLTNVITHSGENIYIFENSNYSISKFDDNFEYINSVTMKQYVNPTELLENAGFFIGCSFDFDERDNSLFSYSTYSFPGLKKKTFFRAEPFSHRNGVPGGKFLLGGHTEYSFFYKNKYIYLLRCKKYRLLKFDLTGTKLIDTTVNVDEIKTNFEKEKEYLQSQGYLKLQHRFSFYDTVMPTGFLIPLRKGFVVTRRKDYNNECTGMVESDYFSYDIEFLGKAKVPCFYKIFFIAGSWNMDSFQYEGNYLYLVNEEGEEYYIEKWQVSE